MGVELYGIEAINANDGWAIAVIGAGIVFSGLVVLSFAIAQIHKLMLLWDKKESLFPLNGKDKEKQNDTIAIDHSSLDINEVAEIYKPVFAKLGETFQLEELYKLSGQFNFPHPHLTIKNFRHSKILIPVGDGFFKLNIQPDNNQK
jgi:hypothetical protein